MRTALPMTRFSSLEYHCRLSLTILKQLIISLLVIAGLILTGCGSPPASTSDNTAVPPSSTSLPTAGLTLPAGYEANIVTRELRSPTQMIIGPDGWLWLAQLAGGENDGAGQVIALSLETGEQRLLLDKLLKPTGIAVLAGGLWIASGRNLLRAPLDEKNAPGPLETVLSDLPFNGRSNGTLTLTPTGRLLFETSGRRSGSRAATGSATLWELDPSDPAHPRPLAAGLKGAYAHTFDEAGRLWTTEIGDDLVNNAPPPDELNLVVEGADFGWPRCFGQQQAALNYGGSETECRTTRAPVSLFPPRSTPTSIVISPWQPDTLLVALWGPIEPAVAAVTFTLAGDNAVGQSEVFITGLQNPQSLLLLPDKSLLVSDFSAGVIYRIRRSGAAN